MSLDEADKASTVSLDDELSFDKADFFLQINASDKQFFSADKVFYNLIVSLWVCVARHAQSAQITSVQHLCNISKKSER